MARFSSSTPEVRQLVDELLVPGFLATGSVAALTRAVADLAGAAPGQPHPARISALLADDPTRGVNESTMDILRRAAIANPWRDDRTAARRRDEVAAEARPHATAGMSAGQVAELLSLPTAVARVAMPGDVPPAPGRRAEHDEADWSFQDVAVDRCLALLRRRPPINVGLVLPTGAGKTRTALRVILETLGAAPEGARAIWITHRHLLREQAARELAKLVDRPPAGLPENAAALADRIVVAMIGEVPDLIAAEPVPPALLVIDEAHHAAAPSYDAIFDRRRGSPILLLTATPIRPDEKPIRIDEIAYTVTYRELARRNAILIPSFEPLPVDTFDMTDETIREIARTVADETASRFRKTLVVASRVDQVEALTDALKAEIERRPDHPLRSSDVGFIHGTRNSHMLSDEAMLALFAGKPRAVLVSAQMLLEGFDDPTIDSVVITYRTSSVIKLMQAAGRCVRRSPGKRQAWVLQVDNPLLGYRFDERWLYQEISDRVRPRVEGLEYGSPDELAAAVGELMQRFNVADEQAARIMAELGTLDPTDEPRLLLYGLPYFGRPGEFPDKAEWGAFLESRANADVFRRAFNGYCAISPEPPDPNQFLDAHGVRLGLPEGRSRLRRNLMDVLTATYFARRETMEAGGAVQDRRGYLPHGATTWLRYVTARRRIELPRGFAEFLEDCHNGSAIAAIHLDDPAAHAMAIKVAIPIGGYEAVLLDPTQRAGLLRWLDILETALRATEPARQLARLSALLAETPPPPLAPLHLARCEPMIPRAGRARLAFDLTDPKE